MRLTPHPDAIIREAACEVSSRPARASSPTSSQTAHPFFFSSSLTARVFSLSSSRTARRTEPGSRQAPRKDRWMTSFAVGEAIPACAGMTAINMSSRTARSAEPGSSAIPSATPILPATLPAPNALTRIQRVAASCATSMGVTI